MRKFKHEILQNWLDLVGFRTMVRVWLERIRLEIIGLYWKGLDWKGLENNGLELSLIHI